mgnify:CR=1 FL=1
MSSNLKKSIFSVLLLVVMAVLFAVPAAAQDAPADTITVSASAFASGAPTQANIELGVEIFGESVKDSFAQSNEAIRAIYAALVGLGIEEKDIQTANLSVYSNVQYSPEGMERKGYQVNNTVRVLIRDITQVDAVIDAAIAAGATSMYGLTFSIVDTAGLETEARAAAFATAQARAAELAALVHHVANRIRKAGVIDAVQNHLGNGLLSGGAFAARLEIQCLCQTLQIGLADAARGNLLYPFAPMRGT